MTTRNNNKPIERVVVIVAMEEEAEPFIAKHGLIEQKQQQQQQGSGSDDSTDTCTFLPGMPMVCYRGTVKGIDVCLVWTGRDTRYKVNNVATTAASVATYASLHSFGPVDLVVSAGTAGGFASIGGRVGDVYLSTKCVFHNRRIPNSTRGYEEYGFGHFRSPSVPLLAARCGLKQGVVSTSDCLDFSPLDLELMRGEGAAVKEMEAAAVAWVCQQVQVPFLAVKSITDIVDGPDTVDDEFYANLQLASEALQEKLSLILESLSEAPLSYWAGNGGVGGPSMPALAAMPAAAVATAVKKIPAMIRTTTPSQGDDANKPEHRLTSAFLLVAVAGVSMMVGATFAKRRG